jgi:hypothetical protein
VEAFASSSGQRCMVLLTPTLQVIRLGSGPRLVPLG